jgi:hypothetical protein
MCIVNGQMLREKRMGMQEDSDEDEMAGELAFMRQV